MSAMQVRAEAAEATAFELAELCGSLMAVVAWCVDNPGECLTDHPARLTMARGILGVARERCGEGRDAG